MTFWIDVFISNKWYSFFTTYFFYFFDSFIYLTLTGYNVLNYNIRVVCLTDLAKFRISSVITCLVLFNEILLVSTWMINKPWKKPHKVGFRRLYISIMFSVATGDQRMLLIELLRRYTSILLILISPTITTFSFTFLCFKKLFFLASFHHYYLICPFYYLICEHSTVFDQMYSKSL